MGVEFTGYAKLSVLDPILKVKKQVCVQYGLDAEGDLVPVCTDASPEDWWVDDGSYGDGVDNGSLGVPSGVETGVEEGQVPPGATTLMWRVTALNDGNMPLTGVHVGADVVSFAPEPGEPSAGVESNTCTDMKFAATYDSDGKPRTDALHNFFNYSAFGSFDEAGLLMPDQSISQICSTELTSGFSGTVQNTVGLNAIFDDIDDPMYPAPNAFYYDDDGAIIFPDGSNMPLINSEDILQQRFVGYGGVQGEVPSNLDSAQVTISDPGLKLTKWVCESYDENRAPDCVIPPSGSDALRQMAGIGAEQNEDGTWPVIEGTAPTDGEYAGWVKAATVPYESDAMWLLVATNTGNTSLTNIDFTTEETQGKHGATDKWVPVESPGVLVSGDSATYTVTTHDITDIHPFGPGKPSSYTVANPLTHYCINVTDYASNQTTQNCTDYTAHGEYPYVGGEDVVNTAVAKADPVNPDTGEPIPGPGDENYGPIYSNPSTAEARAETPHPALKVTKWVCSIGTGCSYDLTHEKLQQLTGSGTTPVTQGMSVSGVTAEGVEWAWLPETLVGYDTAADWLVVATNIGDVSLSNIDLTDTKPTGPNQDGTSDLAQTGADESTPDSVEAGVRVLASGDSIAYKATTSGVRNLHATDPAFDDNGAYNKDPWYEPDRKSGDDSLVNSVVGNATVWDVIQHEPLPDLDVGGDNPPAWIVDSNVSTAEVDSITVAIGDWVWYDNNEDGLQGEVSSGVPGVTVDLLHADGTPVTDGDGNNITTLTDEYGFYYFDMLAPGAYRVAFHLPLGYTWTTAWAVDSSLPAGESAAEDSDAAYAFPFPGGVDPTSDPADASGNSEDVVRVSKVIDVDVRTALDYANHDHVVLTSQAEIPDRYKNGTDGAKAIQAPYINPTIDAGLIAPLPGIKVTKWVCSQYNQAGVATCPDPNLPENVDALSTLAGYDAGQHQAIAGQPAGGWVKEATIPYGADAQWIMVVTNIGNTTLANVRLADRLEGDGRGATGTVDPYPLLAPGASHAFTLTTQNITNGNETIPGIDEDGEVVSGEPTYKEGPDDVRNYVVATGDPVRWDAETAIYEPIIDQATGQPLPPEVSNTSSAEVNAFAFAIGDYVWVDSNKDGVQDSTETPMAGVEVTLFDSATDAQVATTTTDGQGLYLFDNLRQGTYYVRFTLPAGYSWTEALARDDTAKDSDADQTTGRTSDIVLGLNDAGQPLPGLETPSADLGYAVNAEWINPTIDAGLIAPQPGIKITKWVCSTYVQSAVTGEHTAACADPGTVKDSLAGFKDGQMVAGAAAGGWAKEAQIPYGATAQWILVVTNTGDTSLDNLTVTDSLAGDQPVEGAGHTSDPVPDPTNPTILGPGQSALFWVDTQSITSTNPSDPAVDTATVDSAGEPAYATGTDVVNSAQATGRPVTPDGTVIVKPDGKTPLDKPESNISSAEVNTVDYAIGDYVWIDADRDGVQGGAETPIKDVLVSLYTVVGGEQVGQPMTARTDEKGFYLFDNLPEGTYQVLFTLPGGYVWTKTGAGTDSAKDSDADQVTGLSGLIILGEGESGLVAPSDDLGYAVSARWINPTIDAGVYVPKPGLKVTKWVCTNFTTGCADPAGADLTAMAGYDPTTGVKPGEPELGWDKETMAPDENTEVQWLVVVTNTGTETLKNVALSDSYSKGAGAGALTCETDTRTLLSGASTIYHCATASVSNTQPYLTGTVGDGQPDPVFGEPQYAVGDDVVNAAKASGNPVDAAGNPVPVVDDHGNPVVDDQGRPLVESNVSEAEVDVTSYAVGDYVWIDMNGDGRQDPEEPGVEGATVYLLQDGQIVGDPAGVRTNADGYYFFDLLNPGDYQVQFVLPDGYIWTDPGKADPTLDSDAVPDRNKTQARASSAVFPLGPSDTRLVAAGSAPDSYKAGVKAQFIDPTIDAGIVPVAPSIDLAKYVCVTGTDCAVPASFASLDAPNSEWVKATTVSYNTSADWLVLVRNTGNVSLADVELVQEDFTAGGLGFDVNDCAPGLVTDRLAPGAVASWRCTVNHVVNTEDLDSEHDVVNTASAQGTPVNDDGGRMRGPDGNDEPPIQTPPDTAQVRTEAYAVGDYVWIDANNNGQQDPGEKGVPDATVRLLDAAGNLVGVPATTSATGYYYFDLLAPGDYMIEFVLPNGYMWTQTKTPADTAGTDSDAAYTDNLQATARSAVFHLGEDAEGLVPREQAPEDYRDDIVAPEINPTIDAGVVLVEPGIDLKKLVCSTGTGCDPAGVSWDDPQGGWVKSATVEYGASVDWLILVKNTGNVTLTNVSLTKEDFGDSTGFDKGTCDTSLAPHQSTLAPGGVTYFACRATNVTNIAPLGSGEDVVNTAQAQGTPPELPPIPTPPDTAEVDSVAYAVGDFVWTDTNANGIQDTGESGIQDVYVHLLDGSGNPLKTTTTGPNGAYLFDGLPAGTYMIEFVLPSGRMWTQAVAGTNDRVDSDAIFADGDVMAATARSAQFSLGDGERNMDDVPAAQQYPAGAIRAVKLNPSLDAGVILIQPGIDLKKLVCGTGTGCDLANVSWDDPQGGWVESATVEYGASVDWLILVKNTGNVTLTNVSLTKEDFGDSTGFDKGTCNTSLSPNQSTLSPGGVTYFTCRATNVTNTAPLGSGEDVVNTAQAQGTPPELPPIPTPPDTADVDSVAYAVGDFVWTDTNANGIQDLDESGVAGVNVRLLDGDGNLLRTTATGLGGYYLFDRLPKGTYMVEFQLPGGRMWTQAEAGTNDRADSDAVFADGDVLQEWARSAPFALGEGEHNMDAVPGQYQYPGGGDVVAKMANPSLDAGVVLIQPGIDLKKLVCGTGTGCDPAGVSWDDPQGGWVESATVEYGASVDWLILVKNTGNVTLTDVSLAREDFLAGGTGFDKGTCDTSLAPEESTLAPGGVTYFACRADNVTNTADLDSDDAVVNTAQAQGTPPDRPPITTPPDVAKVDSVAYAVGDFVWADTNADGIQDPGESGVAGVNVRLLDADGNLLRTTATGLDGYYLFDRLPKGTYMVEFQLPGGRMWTQAGAGTNDRADSDAVFADGDVLQEWARSAPFALGEGEHNMDAVPGQYQYPGGGDVVAKMANPSLDAGVVLIQPGIDLKKLVCSTGTGCDPKAASWDDPQGGWVKAATVPYNTSVDWLILVKNTGNIDLADVNLIREDFEAGGGGFVNKDCAIPDEPVALLRTGEVTYFTCTVDNVTNAQAHGSGQDVVNTAQASGTPVNKEPPITTPPDTAEVNTAPPVIKTGGAVSPDSHNWVLPLLALSGMLGASVLVVRRRLD